MNDIVLNNEEQIENMIYEIRGKQVMLDSDLAKLYQLETKRIDEAVKNNIEKFPERFSWILLQEEWKNLRSKFSTLENNVPGKGHYRKYLPRVFTEQGVAMLATILKSKIATQVSIRIMDAFVEMKKYISSSLIEQKYINNLVLEDHNKIQKLESAFQKIEKYNVQYSNLKIIYTDEYHDRYFILDKKIVYHCGASINRIGYKTFSITLISDEDVTNTLIEKVNDLRGI